MSSKPIKYKLLIPLLITLLCIFVIFYVFITKSYKNFHHKKMIEQNKKIIIILSKTIPDSVTNNLKTRKIQAYCKKLANYLKQNVSFIDKKGVIRANSESNYSSLKYFDNFMGNPEISQLKNKSYTCLIKKNKLDHNTTLYTAAKITKNGNLIGYIRLSKDLSNIKDQMLYLKIYLFLIIIFSITVITVIVIKFSSKLISVLTNIQERSNLIAKDTPIYEKWCGYSYETDSIYNSLNKTSQRVASLLNKYKEQNNEIKELLLCVSESVIAIDKNTKILFANRNALNIFESNINIEKIRGVPLIGLTHSHKFQNEAETTIKEMKKRIVNINFTNTYKSYDFKAVFTPINISNNKSSLVILITIVDVTEETSLARSKTYFVEAASHELRTPLTILKGYLETLEEKPDEKMAENCIKRIKSSVLRLETIVHDLIKLSQIESGKTNFKPCKFDLNKLIQQIIDELKPLLQEKNIEYQINCAVNIISVKELIYIILFNLISNAVKYNKQNGTIKIDCNKNNDYLFISITDSGIGIKPELREKVFERFYRIDKDRSRHTGGTGLGLSIVKHILITLNGTINITDGINNGSSFKIKIPLLYS